MQKVWDDVLRSVDNYEEDLIAAAVVVSPSTLPVSIETTLTNPPNDVTGEDPYMSTEAMTPVSVVHCPSSISSHVQNIDSPVTLTPIFKDLSGHSSPITIITENDCESLIKTNTPVPSPINKHAKCGDAFCCLHDKDEFECLSVNTVDTYSNQSSPAPGALIRNRGKKRSRTTNNGVM